MADWPDLATLKRALDVDGDALDVELEDAMDGAISGVQDDIGAEGCIAGHEDVGEDQPCSRLARAALLRAVRDARAPAGAGPSPLVGRGDGSVFVSIDPAYNSLLKGHRAQFGVA